MGTQATETDTAVIGEAPASATESDRPIAGASPPTMTEIDTVFGGTATIGVGEHDIAMSGSVWLANQSVRKARTAIYNAIVSATVAGVDLAIVDGVPRIGEPGQPFVVLINWRGSTPEEHLFDVEVYAQASAGDVRRAQDLFLDLCGEIDLLLDAATQGPPGCSSLYDASLDSWVCVFSLQYPRDDF